MTSAGGLQRRLGLNDAVVVGAGSMVGAGVFAVWGPAAGAAGSGLLLGLAVAALVACCNALSSAQLAAVYPESGGTYVYACRQLGPTWGHLAGWGFVVGKTASCAVMALTVGAYLWPQQARAVAVGSVMLIVAVNVGGLTRTVAVTRLLLAASLLALTLVVIAGWSGSDPSLERLAPFDTDLLGVLRSAGLMFFAFAGYARIATLGEEVRDPATTIPRAIPVALASVLVLYAVVAVTALAVVPVEALAATDAPLRLVVEAGGGDALVPVVRIGAGIASLGVLLNLIPGISRTVLAMARRRELPDWFAQIDAERSLPLRAELTVAVVVTALVVALDLRDALALSGVAVLVYYAITNASAFSLRPSQRRWPRGLAVVGFVGCLTLIGALPASAIVTGGAVLAVGVVARVVGRRLT